MNKQLLGNFVWVGIWIVMAAIGHYVSDIDSFASAMVFGGIASGIGDKVQLWIED